MRGFASCCFRGSLEYDDFELGKSTDDRSVIGLGWPTYS